MGFKKVALSTKSCVHKAHTAEIRAVWYRCEIRQCDIERHPAWYRCENVLYQLIKFILCISVRLFLSRFFIHFTFHGSRSFVGDDVSTINGRRDWGSEAPYSGGGDFFLEWFFVFVCPCMCVCVMCQNRNIFDFIFNKTSNDSIIIVKWGTFLKLWNSSPYS